MKTLVATFLIAACAGCAGVTGQNDAQSDGSAGPTRKSADCAHASSPPEVDTLYGRWQVRIDGQPDATAELGPHPEYGGVRGRLTRPSGVAQLAGDVDDEGTLALDESEDGRTISATWTLTVQPDSCGKEFKGTWQHAGDEAKRPAVITLISRAPG
ncbi:MAG: hypothetical protein DI563_15550 [Variovorax paradoxus]|uniref:Lipoprotein n=1 Tax=Variovorax paradoxus TaxID=34073 RepID=A0A2W5S0F0_VARPD|nr:MAG: hypothetical protein DI563_15550 [Variovorax paradoxus]